jgi:hypothetical protein
VEGTGGGRNRRWEEQGERTKEGQGEDDKGRGGGRERKGGRMKKVGRVTFLFLPLPPFFPDIRHPSQIHSPCKPICGVSL